MNSPLKENKKEVYRKREIADKYCMSISTINNRIKDGTFTKIILHGNSRLVYFDCDEIDRYFRGEAPKINKNDASIITSQMTHKVQLMPKKKREDIEVLLKRIKDVENGLGLDSIIEEVEQDKKAQKRKLRRRKLQRRKQKVTLTSDDEFVNKNHQKLRGNENTPKRAKGYKGSGNKDNQHERKFRGSCDGISKSGGKKVCGNQKMISEQSKKKARR